jgi:uncharacterized membrane protein YozB (DUF420 family)
MQAHDADPLIRAGTLSTVPGWIKVAFFAPVGLLVLATSARALSEIFHNDDFPDLLALKLEHLPLIFPLHMASGAISLLLVPLVFLLRRRPSWHRWAGRAASVLVVVGALTAWPVAWMHPVSWMTAAGFSVQAALWLGFLGAGIRAIRRGRIAAHRRAMLLMMAVTSGAVFFRVWLALWAWLAFGWHFALVYSCDAWLGWLLPLMATWAWLRRERARAVLRVGLASSQLPRATSAAT